MVAGGEEVRRGEWLFSLAAIGFAMGAGSVVSRGIAACGVTLPGYIGAMIVAAGIRFVDDRGRRRLDELVLGQAGGLSLGLFIVMALLTLKLWVLASLAVPLVVSSGSTGQADPLADCPDYAADAQALVAAGQGSDAQAQAQAEWAPGARSRPQPARPAAPRRSRCPARG